MANPRKRKVLKLRSTFEERIVKQLDSLKVSFEYETMKIRYQKKPSTYTPDIILSNGIVIEVKGYFDSADRSKHLLVKEQHPHIDLRFVFQVANKKIHKSSKMTYASWCEKHGFQYAEKEIPSSWITEV